MIKTIYLFSSILLEETEVPCMGFEPTPLWTLHVQKNLLGFSLFDATSWVQPFHGFAG
jgi:hypothetical protein